MRFESLTFKSIRARPVVLKLERPVVARIATINDWPLILIDLTTDEGIVGRSYLEPYTAKAMRYLIPALHDFGAMLVGRRVTPIELYDLARKSLHFVGYQGMSMIAVSGLDMAAWDALAQAAGVPLCVLLGGSVGPVPAYNSNGLWLKEPAAVAAEAIELRDEGGFTGLKLRLGREHARRHRNGCGRPRRRRRRHAPDDRLQPGAPSRGRVAPLPCDRRSRTRLDRGAHRLRQLPRLHTARCGACDTDPDRRELLRAARSSARARLQGVRLRHAGLHADRRRHGLAACSGHRRHGGRADVDASLSGSRRPRDARDRDGALARMAGLGRSHPAETVRNPGRPAARSRDRRIGVAVERRCGGRVSLQSLGGSAGARRLPLAEIASLRKRTDALIRRPGRGAQQAQQLQ